MAFDWGQHPVQNAAGSQVAGTFRTPVQSGAGHLMGAPMAQPKPATSSLAAAGAPAQPMASPTAAPNPNAPYAANSTGGGQYTLSSVQGTGLLAPFNDAFHAPTNVTEQNDPGYQFRLNEGLDAYQKMAAAHGTLLTGGTVKGAENYAQNFASNEYGNVYGRAKGEYDTARDIYNQNKTSQYNTLNGIAGQGLNAAGQAADIAQGQGNAQAAGTAAQGGIYGNLAGTLGDLGAEAWLYRNPGTPKPAPNLNQYVHQTPNPFGQPLPSSAGMMAPPVPYAQNFQAPQRYGTLG